MYGVSQYVEHKLFFPLFRLNQPIHPSTLQYHLIVNELYESRNSHDRTETKPQRHPVYWLRFKPETTVPVTYTEWGSSVTILPDNRLVDRGFDPRQRQRIFPLASVTGPALRPTQNHIQGDRRSFPGGKAQLRRNANHSPTSSAEVKKE
jgi:hypothetical protein